MVLVQFLLTFQFVKRITRLVFEKYDAIERVVDVLNRPFEVLGIQDANLAVKGDDTQTLVVTFLGA